MRISLISFFLVLGIQAYSQIGGSSVYSFLNTIPSARVAAQGSNAIANTSNDLNFALFNPALLNAEMDKQIAFSIVDYPSDIVYGDFNYAHHFDSIGTFSFGLRYFDYGTFDRANTFGVKAGTFSAQDFAFQVGYAYSLDSNWHFGTNAKIINSVYESYSSFGVATDIAVNYLIPQKRVALALLFKNIGYQVDPFLDTREGLPFEIQFAISNKFEHLPLRWQITLEQLETFDLSYTDPAQVTVNQFTGEVDDGSASIGNKILRHVILGVEFAPTEGFNLQFAYNFRKRTELNLDSRRTSAGFSAGLGFKISKFYLNYARNWYHVSGSANHISLRTDLNSFN